MNEPLPPSISFTMHVQHRLPQPPRRAAPRTGISQEWAALVRLASVMSVVVAIAAALLAGHNARTWIVGAIIVVTSMISWHRIEPPVELTRVPLPVRRR